MKKSILTFLFLLSTIASFAISAEVDGILYSYSSSLGEAEVIGSVTHYPSVVIPATVNINGKVYQVTKIRENSFVNNTSIVKICSLNPTPPRCKWGAFKNVPESTPIYVPAESVEKYKAAYGWKDFTNILPIEAESNK